MKKQSRAISPAIIVQLILVVFLAPLLPLLISRRWDWWEAWIYAFIAILGFIVSRALANRRSPDLLAERASFMQHENVKPWDKWLAPLVGLGGGLIPLIAGLEMGLGGTFRLALPVKIVALFFLLGGYALGSYALIENRFFSGMVRIQNDRGHQVVSSGPYRWVRHPGYAGAILSYLAAPLLLDSIWGFGVALLISVLLVIRTHLEDKTLQAELDGYRDYAHRVRYRLFPGLW